MTSYRRLAAGGAWRYQIRPLMRAALAGIALAAACGCRGESPPPNQRITTPAVAPKPLSGNSDSPPVGVLPAFRDIAESSGVHFLREDDMRGEHRIIEVNGGGAALFDYDDDSDLDLFLTDGCHWPATDRQERSNQLFRNLGGGRFARATVPAGLVAEAYFTGCTVGDFDSDGFEDLYVGAFGRDRFWRNNGDGSFADVTERAGATTDLWTSSPAFADLNRDGILDLVVITYVDPHDPIRLCPNPESPDGYIQCPPTMFSAVDDLVFLGDGIGHFVDVTRSGGFTGVDGKGLGVVIFDADRDGLPDVYVANDGMPNFLYMNETDDAAAPRFREEAMLRGAAVNMHGVAEASMGVAAGDFDANGATDLYITNFYLETNILYSNVGDGNFEDATSRSRLGPPSRLTLGFGTEPIDWDNDGWLDLIVANGHIDDYGFLSPPEPYRMHPQLFRNERDGTFAEVSHWGGDYFRGEWVGRGLAVGDIDGDGDLDAVISHQLDPSAILRNDTATENGSVILKLVGRGDSNRSGFGALVEAEGLDHVLVREVIGGGSFQSSSDRRVHVGIGDRDAIPKLRIRWPSGAEDVWDGVRPGQYVMVEGQPPVPLPSR